MLRKLQPRVSPAESAPLGLGVADFGFRIMTVQSDTLVGHTAKDSFLAVWFKCSGFGGIWDLLFGMSIQGRRRMRHRSEKRQKESVSRHEMPMLVAGIDYKPGMLRDRLRTLGFGKQWWQHCLLLVWCYIPEAHPTRCISGVPPLVNSDLSPPITQS